MLTFYSKIMASDIARRMGSGAFWSLTGTALGKMCILLAGIVCARILGKEGFGEFGMVRSTIGMFIVMGSAGIGVTATRFISEYRENDKSKAAAIYRLSNRFSWRAGIVITLALLLTSPLLAEHILQAPQLSVPIRIGALLLLASILNASQQGALSGMEDFHAIAVNTLKASLAETALMIAGAYIWGVEGAVIGFGTGIVVLWIANQLSVRNDFRRAGIEAASGDLGQESRRILYHYCLPATLTALTITPAFFAIRVLLVRDCDYGELAIFEAADQWKVIILFIPTAVSNIALPILSSMSKKPTFVRTLIANIALVGTVAAVMAFVIGIASPLIMPLYGTEFNNHEVLILLAISTVFSSVSSVMEMAIYSKDRMWPCFLMNLVWAILLISGCHQLLFMGYGASAPAWAVLLSYLAKTIYMGIYIRRIHEAE